MLDHFRRKFFFFLRNVLFYFGVSTWFVPLFVFYSILYSILIFYNIKSINTYIVFYIICNRILEGTENGNIDTIWGKYISKTLVVQLNLLSANPSPNRLMLPMNCLSMFDHFMGLAFKGLTTLVFEQHDERNSN